ncbi:LysM peptidoglycan-binding domain-containing protein [Gordonia sp. DT30]|uniref:LysM peptidoglycan-binding domain-containing protein n=1 Tax=unclassified Gordonia (in: high G+C Gram-positive bacteria) TaxID=2657482 RepID=UPI003CEBE50D
MHSTLLSTDQTRVGRTRTDQTFTGQTRAGATNPVPRARPREQRPLDPRRAPRRSSAVSRPADRRPIRPVSRRIPGADGTWCTSPAGSHHLAGTGDPGGHRSRRTGALVAVLTGVALALLVWLVAVAGSDYQESAQRGSARPAPIATQVVHVRAGESLNAIAARVAPDMPRQSVIEKIVELNDMSGSAVQAGQSLLAPAYR